MHVSVQVKAWGVAAVASSCLLLLGHHAERAVSPVASAVGMIIAACIAGSFTLQAALITSAPSRRCRLLRPNRKR
ncbi:hypothetical protein JCM9533A_50120 [Catenuloplanes niger JCM 9533]